MSLTEDTYWEAAQEQERRVLGTLPKHWENESAVAEFQNDGLVAATDGSFEAAGSWMLAADERKIISGASPVDGDAETLDSYRAELGALRSLVYYIRFLRRTRPALTKDIVLTVWIDNLQALRHGTGEDPTTPIPDRLQNE